jgi:hypothetical protein
MQATKGGQTMYRREIQFHMMLGSCKNGKATIEIGK